MSSLKVFLLTIIFPLQTRLCHLSKFSNSGLLVSWKGWLSIVSDKYFQFQLQLRKHLYSNLLLVVIFGKLYVNFRPPNVRLLGDRVCEIEGRVLFGRFFET